MAKIFICYRREDGAYPAHQIYRELNDYFGSESVVFDVDTMPLGTDFREYLNNQVSECDILLAIIGDQWAEILKQRHGDPKDFVRIEIQAALERDIPVVPILVGKALMPSEKHLPPELEGLSYRSAAEVRAGSDLADHLKRLIKGLDRLLAQRKAEEDRKSKEPEAKLKPEKPEPEASASIEPKSSQPRKSRNVLKYGAAAGVIVLLAIGIWLYISKPTLPPKARTAKDQAAQVQKEVETLPGHIFRDRLKVGGEGPEMIILEAGNFLMGSPETERGRSQNEGSQHGVTISRPFALSTHEITFAEYDIFAKATGGEIPNDEGWGRGDRPVINVSWVDATAYAGWLSEQTEQQYRLPTEAEWEYAARAGSASMYSFGNDESKLGEYAWFSGNSEDKTHPVGQKKPNAWGLYDMHGNVWEWVQDYFDYYRPNSAVVDPKGPGKRAVRVIRGGGWRGGAAQGCRSASRDGLYPAYHYDYVGFRLARSITHGP